MNYQYLRKVTAGILMFGVSMVPLAHAANVNSKTPSPPHYKKGALCVQETSKPGMFICWGMFGNELVSVEEIYKHGWRVVAFKPRTDNPDMLDNGWLFIEEQ